MTCRLNASVRGLVLLCCLGAVAVGATSHPAAATQKTTTAAYAASLELAIELVVNDTMLVPQLQRMYDAAPYTDVEVDPAVSSLRTTIRVEQILSTQPLRMLRSLAQAAVTAHHAAAASGSGAEQTGATEGDYVRPEQVNGTTHARFSVPVDTQRSTFILNGAIEGAGARGGARTNSGGGPTQVLSSSNARFLSGMTNATRLNFEKSDSVTFQCTKTRRSRDAILFVPSPHRLLSR